MGLFDAWKKRKKKRAVIKTAKNETFGKKLGGGTKTAIQKKREAEEELLKDL